MPTENTRGPFEDLHVHDTRRVVGAVDGLCADEHSAVTIVGVLRGRIRVAKNATVVVHGVLEAGEIVSEGRLMVWGIVNGSRIDFDGAGELAVAVGSVVNGQVIELDGSLRTPLPDEAIEVGPESTDWCVWLTGEGRFQRVCQ